MQSTDFCPIAYFGKFSDYDSMENRTFAEKLQAVIDADPNLTAAGLAVKAGLDNSAIRALLSGRVKNPRLDTAAKICAALGTTYDDFMRETPSSEEQELLALANALPEHLRRQLLGYGQALLHAQNQGPKEAPENNK